MQEKNYSTIIIDAINQFFNNDGWNFSFDSERGIFRLGYSLKGKLKRLSLIIGTTNDGYNVYAVAPVGVDKNDEKTLAEMAEFICRANYGLKNGNFELDMRDGEIRYKIYVDCSGIEPTQIMVQNSIFYPIGMFERYGEGILGIFFGGMSAKEAIEMCEK